MGAVAFLLLEDGGYLLQEDNGKIILEPTQYLVAGDYGTYTVTGRDATIQVGGATGQGDQLLIVLRSFTERRRF